MKGLIWKKKEKKENMKKNKKKQEQQELVTVLDTVDERVDTAVGEHQYHCEVVEPTEPKEKVFQK